MHTDDVANDADTVPSRDNQEQERFYGAFQNQDSDLGCEYYPSHDLIYLCLHAHTSTCVLRVGVT